MSGAAYRVLPSLRALAGGLLGGAALSAGVALTATSGWLVVRASERPVILTLMTAIVAVRTFGLARPLFRHGERLVSHDAALEDLARARARLYADLVPLTPARLGAAGRGRVLTGAVDDLTEAVEAQVRVGVPLVATAVTGTLAALLTALVDPAVGLAVSSLLVVAAATSVLAWWLETRGQDELLAARAEAVRLSELVAGDAAGLQAVGAEAWALARVAAAHRVLADRVGRQSRGRALAAALLPLSTAAATVVAAAAVADGRHPAPVAALLVLAPFALADVLGGLPDVVRALARAQAAGGRVEALRRQPPAVVGTGTGLPARPLLTAERAPILTLRRVHASWDGHRDALGPVDLELTPGSSLAVTGPSGCGKSTLLAVLARHLDPSAGSYLIDGVDVRELDLDAVRALVAVVDDAPHLFATTVRDNLRLARPDAGDAEVEAALVAAGLAAWRAGLAAGLDTRLGSGGIGVSGGERARLAIARALLSRRPVLLLDEPVAHLDHATAVAVLADLHRASADRTVVVVSHRVEGLDLADGIMDLDGAVVGRTGPGIGGG